MHRQEKRKETGTISVNVPGYGVIEVPVDCLAIGGTIVQVPEKLLLTGGNGYINVPIGDPPIVR